MMRGSLRVLGAEWSRLVTARSAHICALLLVIVPVLRVMATFGNAKLADLEREARGGQAIGLDGGTGWAPFIDGWRAGLMLGVALLLVHAARSLAGDRESGLLRIPVTRSASPTFSPSIRVHVPSGRISRWLSEPVRVSPRRVRTVMVR